MRLFSLIIGLALAGCATTATFTPAADTEMEVAVERAISETSTPGLAVLEIRAGEMMPEIVRGVRATDTRDAVRPGDSWHLGSNGKPITTTLIAILVERRKLSWESRLVDLLPDLANTMRPEYRDVTVAELASHRGGFPGEGDLALITPHYQDTRPLPMQRTAFLTQILTQPPDHPRGTYMYSNRGFIVLGAIADRLGGKPVEQLLLEMIFRPLRMSSAAFGATPRGQPLGHEAGKPLVGAKQDNPAFWTTAGTIRMSMRDWGRWAIDQMEGERGRGKLLSAKSYKFLHSPQIMPEGRKTAIALDWGVRSESYGRLLTHTGSNGAWYAIIGLAPDARSGILIATNSAEDMKGDAAVLHPFRAATARWKARATQLQSSAIQ